MQPVIRVTLTIQSTRETRLTVSGQISGTAVVLLEREIARWSDLAESIVLDLDAVTSVDDGGLALLRRSVGADLVVHIDSPYLRALLEAEGLGQYLT